MRDPIREPRELKVGKQKSHKRPQHRRTVLPLPADVVDAAFADGVEVELTVDQCDNDSLTYAEVVSKVNEQLDQLEEQRKQLNSLLKEAGKSLQ